ncbi:SPL family radical SAM protein [Deferrisoma palaeochoriense]
MTRPFSRIVVDEDVRDLPFTRAFLGRVGDDVPVEVRPQGAPGPRGRSTAHVTREPGRFLKPCPCSPGVVRCGYWVLTPAFQCPFGCTYCFLRFYAPEEPLTVYANLADAEAEFREALEAWPGPVRLGTGEFADSLALDPWTGHARWLRDLVAPHPRVTLELKTKSDRIDGLLGLEPLPNLVVAWSVNPPERIRTDEPGTAPLDRRLAAAAAAVRAGYRVAFHFDPVTLEPGWREAYSGVVEALFSAVPADRVAWVSLGTLRFPRRFLERWGPKLRGARAFFGEHVPGPDGKLRYFWPLRRDAYRFLADRIRRRGGEELRLYLCMETPAMWHAAFGFEPEPEGDVERWLAAPFG